MVVHAHPDDEASTTGGTLARYAAEGVTTVLVTCTDGSQGDAPGGVKPGEPGHDPEAVVALRSDELHQSCRALGVTHLEELGYPDSGMEGWPANRLATAFCNRPVPEVADRLTGLMERYRPQVVVTYDPTGFYGHPDHVQAHRVTAAAFDSHTDARRLYVPTVPESHLQALSEALSQAGEEVRDPVVDQEPSIFTTPDTEISAWIDCAGVVDAKLAALRAHRSQADNVFFLGLPDDVFRRFFAVEPYVRWRDRTGGALPVQDLFAGLRAGPVDEPGS